MSLNTGLYLHEKAMYQFQKKSGLRQKKSGLRPISKRSCVYLQACEVILCLDCFSKIS
jgi:hypothetical protein